MSTTQASPHTLNVALIGYSFMGAIHAQAWRTAPSFFPTDLTPRVTTVCGRNEYAATEFANRFGIPHVETDWRSVVNDPTIDVIDICVPGHLHTEIALAALAAGKHVLCEKPLANNLDDAERMAAAAASASANGIFASVGFNYRRTPALALAQRMIANGDLGVIRSMRGQYLQDWLVDPTFPLVWRLDAEKAGSGALGDLGAHLIDLAQWVSGHNIDGVSALSRTFISERPLAEASSGLSATAATAATTTATTETATDDSGSAMGTVTVDDAAIWLATTDKGAIGTFEANRFATGHNNALRLEINGSLGSIAFDFERLNELEYFDNRSTTVNNVEVGGFRRIHVTKASHPYLAAWWPAGHSLGYEHTFVHQVADFVAAVAANTPPSPSFEDGLNVQCVLDAVERSAAAHSSWTQLNP
ncbi:Gfo/Idh/MocA family oxidoreductase [Lysinibacter cavernae]|uniref:Putative dehydrogenase n=1 Tax=Lysinibacter cavernae TaxID=1640652 RepID=A0A7X5R3W8_9MICO|nr:putative dehydrogenase [Lysinibacter cavernae]